MPNIDRMREETTELEANTKRFKNETLESILAKFDFVKILKEDAEKKLIIIQAVKREEFSNETELNRNAVCIFEKPHFGLEETKSYLSLNNPFEINIDNDIYKQMSVYPNRPYNNINAQLIYPATDAHISKYSQQEYHFLEESYDDWLNKTSVFLKDSSFDIQWVYNILEHKKESERIVFEDNDPENGFILLPDIKWDGKTVESLYLLAIVHPKNIASLRDLNGTHIKLLENVRDKSFQAIESKYGLKQSKIKAYLHYQPSFYHLHMHFTHINVVLPGVPERNHQLNNVIQNLKLNNDYYQKVTLQYPIKKNEPLFKLYQDRFD